MRLRYAGTCVLCGQPLEQSSEALYDRSTKTVRCVECNPETSAVPIDTGSAGATAHREYERRRALRETRVKSRFGNVLGGIALTLAGESQSARAWERGSIGEQKLAEALEGVDNLIVLNDRRVPGTRGNIDHIMVSMSGVFVVDAKHYAGLIQIRDRGGLFSRDERLYVGSRDCSELAANMGWQVSAVLTAIESAGPQFSGLPVTAVLCFIDGEWPLLMPPESYKGVRLEGKKSIKKLLTRAQVLDHEQIERVSRVLAVAFPAK